MNYAGTIWIDSDGKRYVESKRNGGDQQDGTFEVRLTEQAEGAKPEWWTTEELGAFGMLATDEKA
jgi:hypothetical protein